MTDGSGANPNDARGTVPWPLDRHAFTHRMRVSFPSSKSSISLAVHRIIEIAEKCGINEDDRTDLEIALREALANAVAHGNEFGPDKRVFVRCYASPEIGLLALVRDEGPGFTPEEVPDPRDEDRVHLTHGRGLFLMRALLDYVEHRRKGCEVVLFKRGAAPDATSPH